MCTNYLLFNILVLIKMKTNHFVKSSFHLQLNYKTIYYLKLPI